jgi:hypothetical protein
MSDDGSVFDRVRRTIAGPSPAERAEKLKDRARADSNALDGNDVDELVELLSAEDPDVVGDALSALGSLADERPDLASPAVPSLVDGLSARPQDEWYSTTLGDASQSFTQDLRRGSILLAVAESDPDALDPVVDDLASRYDDGTIEPMSTFALAHVVAESPERVDVGPEPFVERVAAELRGAVDSDGPGDDWTDVTLQIAATDELVDLLSSFDHSGLDDDAVADARDALETAREESDDEEVVEAAAAALERLDRGAGE